MTTDNSCTGIDSCACAKPRPIVSVGGHRYWVIPVEAEEPPTCADCSAPFLDPWKVGRAVDLHNPYHCGMPKKNGEPCQWDVSREPCRVHLSPEELQRIEEHKEAEAERKRQAEERRQQESVQRGLDLIEILTVTCPHCSAPAAALCRSPQGVVGRALHRARLQLAGVDGPKEFVLEAPRYPARPTRPPSVHADPREVLGDPLVDRTAEAQPRYAAELEEAAQRKVDDAKRALWLAEGSREEIILAQACSDCGAEPGAACSRAGRGWGTRAHAKRIDAAMEASA
ncbi:hypothetical protein [Streptomyces sp. NPDC058254]|uniref:zinc finger domain-containing protein n=1 Tax=Streptomyces sp. NPDC058254 TaxID=3346406 RepID=UPI0036EC8B68